MIAKLPTFIFFGIFNKLINYYLFVLGDEQMEDRDKDKEQLQNELMGLHKKIDELEHVKASQK